jgi:hypothetical protein
MKMKSLFLFDKFKVIGMKLPGKEFFRRATIPKLETEQKLIFQLIAVSFKTV